MEGKEEDRTVVELAQRTLQANKEHLEALKTHTQTLEAELQALDKLLDAVDAVDESDLDVGYSVTIPGSVRAIAPIATKDLLSPESPFHGDVLKRSRYQSFTEVHPMKPKELEALAEAVQAENCRKYALDNQRGCLVPNFDTQTPHVPRLNTEGIDWDRIAEKVSAIHMTTRTAAECKIRWLGERHPEFNHAPWSGEEVLKVKSLAADFTGNQPDWVAIAERLGTRRTPLDCMRHATSRKVHQWTTDADERLLKAIRMYGHDNWHLVARYVSEDATASQCSSRFEKTLDESVKRTTWSPEEDARLSAAVAAYGSSWVDVAASVPGRHNDQCRERWTEQVNPSINKGQWSEEEDRVLLDYVREHESASWKEISEHLCNGRTEAMCRARYTVLQKGTNTVRTMSAVNPAHQAPHSVSPTSNTLIFKHSFPNTRSCSTAPASSHREDHHPNQFIFLEPVVSLSSESCEHYRPRSSQTPTRFKTTTARNTLPSNTTTTPPQKRRKTRSGIAKSKKPANKTQQEEPTS